MLNPTAQQRKIKEVYFVLAGPENSCPQRHVMLRTKFNKNGAKIPSKTTDKSTFQLGSILWPTWSHFGKVWGVKMRPSWHQIASKMTLQINPKNDHILDRSWDQFGAPTWLPRGSARNNVSTFFLLLSPSWGQDGPKTPQEPPQIPILIDF